VADLHPERGAGALDATWSQVVPNAGIALSNAITLSIWGGAGVGTEFFGIGRRWGVNNWGDPDRFCRMGSLPALGEAHHGSHPNNGQGGVEDGVEYLDNGPSRRWHGDLPRLVGLYASPPIQRRATGPRITRQDPLQTSNGDHHPPTDGSGSIWPRPAQAHKIIFTPSTLRHARKRNARRRQRLRR